MKYYTKYFHIGNTIQDVLTSAIEANIDGVWHHVLGYDATDDVLSLCGTFFDDGDVDVPNASKVFTHGTLRISSPVLLE